MARPALQASLGITIDPSSLNAGVKEVRQALGRITGNASEFQKSLDASTARVFAFGATTAVISGVSQAFKALVGTTIEVEKRLIEIKSIFGGTASEFQGFRDDIFQVAKSTGQSFSAVADGAAEFARQGLSAAETAKRLEAALILTRVSGLDSVKSVQALTAAINGFSSAGLTAADITNKLVAVDTRFAVSAQDLAEGFSRAGSTAEDAGVSFDELLGIITAVQQKTSRGGAVIGNALKSVFTRLSRSSTIEELKALGVAIDSSQNGIQKLQALSNALSSVADPQQASAIKELAGGVYQINIVSAALKDLSNKSSIFSQATAASANAANDAFEKNKELSKSLASQLNSLVVGFTNLAEKIGQLTFAPLLSSLVGIADKVSTFFNEALDPEKGNKFIQGILKSIGTFLSGPGLVLITTAFFKIVSLVARYAKEGFKSVLEIGSASEKLRSVQAGIVSSLITDKKFRKDISDITLTQAQRQQVVLDAVKRENDLLREKQRILTDISSIALRAGVKGFDPKKGFTDKGGKPKTFGRGFTPSFTETIAETSAAKEHGYKAGKVYNTRLHDGTGKSFKATVNSAEKVKTVRGSNGKLGTYVVPPNGFAKGFVPNFAQSLAERIAKARYSKPAMGALFQSHPEVVKENFPQEYADRIKASQEGGFASQIAIKAKSTATKEKRLPLLNSMNKYAALVAQTPNESNRVNQILSGFVNEGEGGAITTPISKGKNSRYQANVPVLGINPVWTGTSMADEAARQDLIQKYQLKNLKGELIDKSPKRALSFSSMLKDAEDQYTAYGIGGSEDVRKNESSAIGGKFETAISAFTGQPLIKNSIIDFDTNKKMAAFIAPSPFIKNVKGIETKGSDSDGNLFTGESSFVKKMYNLRKEFGVLPEADPSPKITRTSTKKTGPRVTLTESEIDAKFGPQEILDEKGKKEKISYIDSDILSALGINDKGKFRIQLAEEAIKQNKYALLAGAAGSGKSTYAENVLGAGAARSLADIKNSSLVYDLQANKDLIARTLNTKSGKIQKAILLSESARQIEENRLLRDESGKKQFGRAAGTTKGAASDFADIEALFQARLGARGQIKKRVGANWVPKTQEELVGFSERKIATARGAFAPFTLGHKALASENLKSKEQEDGFNPNDIFMSVSRGNSAGTKISPKNERTVIFDREFRLAMAKAGLAGTIPKKNVSLGGRGSSAPFALETTGKKALKRNFIIPSKGSIGLAGEDKDPEKTFGDFASGGYESVKFGIRPKDSQGNAKISGTAAREALELAMSTGDFSGLSGLVPAKVLALLQKNSAIVQNRIAAIRNKEVSTAEEMRALEQSDPANYKLMNFGRGFVPNFATKGETNHFEKGQGFEDSVFRYLGLEPAGSRRLDFPEEYLGFTDAKKRKKIGLRGSFGDLKFTNKDENKHSLLGKLIAHYGLTKNIQSQLNSGRRVGNIDLNQLEPKIGESTLFYKGDPKIYHKETISATLGRVLKAARPKKGQKSKLLEKFNFARANPSEKSSVALKDAYKGKKIQASVFMDGIADPSELAVKGNGYTPNFANIFDAFPQKNERNSFVSQATKGNPKVLSLMQKAGINLKPSRFGQQPDIKKLKKLFQLKDGQQPFNSFFNKAYQSADAKVPTGASEEQMLGEFWKLYGSNPAVQKEYSNIKGSGFVPNFAYKFKKYKDSDIRSISNPKTGSELNYADGETSNGSSYLEMVGIHSMKSGQGLELFQRLGKIARRTGKKVRSSSLIPQKERLELLNQESSIDKILRLIYPQLSYRQKSGVKNTKLDFEFGEIEKTISGQNILDLVNNELKDVKSGELIEAIKNKRVGFSSVVDTFADGFVPNFADLSGQIGSAGVRGGFFKLKNSSGEDRKRIGVKKFDENIPIEALKQPIAQEWLSGKHLYNSTAGQMITGPKIISGLGESIKSKSIIKQIISDKLARDVVGGEKSREFGTGFLAKYIEQKTGLRIPDLHGSNYTINDAAKPYVLGGSPKAGAKINVIDTGLAQAVGDKAQGAYKNFIAQAKSRSQAQKKASGYIPNFSAVQDAISREQKAGVPKSAIYIDQSPKLKSTRNPSGLMVANRIDEPRGGFQGINRAKKEGRNPKTYGAAGGFVPNYASFASSVGQATGIGIGNQSGVGVALQTFKVNAQSAGADMKALSAQLKRTLLGLGVSDAVTKQITAAAQKELVSRKTAIAARQLSTAQQELEKDANKKLVAKLNKIYVAYDASEKTAKDLSAAQAKVAAVLKGSNISGPKQNAIIGSTDALSQGAKPAVGRLTAGAEKLNNGMGKVQASLFALSVASSTLAGDNEELSNNIQKVITAVSLLSLATGALPALVAGATAVGTAFTVAGVAVGGFAYYMYDAISRIKKAETGIAVSESKLKKIREFKSANDEISLTASGVDSGSIEKIKTLENQYNSARDLSAKKEEELRILQADKRIADSDFLLGIAGGGFENSTDFSKIPEKEIAVAESRAEQERLYKELDAAKKAVADQNKTKPAFDFAKNLSSKTGLLGDRAREALSTKGATDKAKKELEKEALDLDERRTELSTLPDSENNRKNIAENAKQIDENSKKLADAIADSKYAAIELATILENGSKDVSVELANMAKSFSIGMESLNKEVARATESFRKKTEIREITKSITPKDGKFSGILAKQLDIETLKSDAQNKRSKFSQGFGEVTKLLDPKILKISDAPEKNRAESEALLIASKRTQQNPNPTLTREEIGGLDKVFKEEKFAAGQEAAKLAQSKIAGLNSGITGGELPSGFFESFVSGGEEAFKKMFESTFSFVDLGKEGGEELYKSLLKGAEDFKSSLLDGYIKAKNIQTEMSNQIKANGLELIKAQKDALSGIGDTLEKIQGLQSVDPLDLFKKLEKAAELQKTGNPADVKKANEILINANPQIKTYRDLMGEEATQGLQARAGLNPNSVNSSVASATFGKLDLSSIFDLIKGSPDSRGAFEAAKVDPSKVGALIDTIQREFAGTSREGQAKDAISSLRSFSAQQNPNSSQVSASLLKQYGGLTSAVPENLKQSIASFQKNPKDEQAFEKLKGLLVGELGQEKGTKYAEAYKKSGEKKNNEFDPNPPVTKLQEAQKQAIEELEKVNVRVREFAAAFQKESIVKSVESLSKAVDDAAKGVTGFGALTVRLDAVSSEMLGRIEKVEMGLLALK